MGSVQEFVFRNCSPNGASLPVCNISPSFANLTALWPALRVLPQSFAKHPLSLIKTTSRVLLVVKVHNAEPAKKKKYLEQIIT